MVLYTYPSLSVSKKSLENTLTNRAADLGTDLARITQKGKRNTTHK